MAGTIKAVLGAIGALLGLLGLYVASRAGGGPLEEAGLILAAGALAFVFFLLKRHCDQWEQGRG